MQKRLELVIKSSVLLWPEELSLNFNGKHPPPGASTRDPAVLEVAAGATVLGRAGGPTVLTATWDNCRGETIAAADAVVLVDLPQMVPRRYVQRFAISCSDTGVRPCPLVLNGATVTSHLTQHSL